MNNRITAALSTVKRVSIFTLTVMGLTGTIRAQDCQFVMDFDQDANGNDLAAGTVITEQFADWGIHITTSSPTNHPAMIFDSASPTGGDPDLGTPNEDFGGPGVGNGGDAGSVGQNDTEQFKVLIISEDNDSNDPDDNAGGGVIIFTFDQPMDIYSATALDTESAMTFKAYNQANIQIGVQATLALGNNSFQTVALNFSDVYKLRVILPESGAIPSLTMCGGLRDYGDAPELPYPTTDAASGAYHLLIDGGVYLGSMVDADNDGQPTGFADGDDISDGNDDEDGVDFPYTSATTGFPALAINSNNCLGITASADGYLNAWLDLGLDGSWSQVIDHIIVDEALTTGLNVVCFDVPLVFDGNTGMRFRFNQDDPNGSQSYTDGWSNGEVEDYIVTLGGTLDNDDTSLLPAEVKLNSAYPNPFNPSTTLSYQIQNRGLVSLQIFDLKGRLVETLVDEVIDAGSHEVIWHAESLPTGLYIAKLISGGNVNTQKLSYIK